MAAEAIRVRLVLVAQDGDEERTEEDFRYLLDELDQAGAVNIERESVGPAQALPRQAPGVPVWTRLGQG